METILYYTIYFMVAYIAMYILIKLEVADRDDAIMWGVVWPVALPTALGLIVFLATVFIIVETFDKILPKD